MAEIKWIKLTTDMFDNRKIKHLRRLPDGNNIVLIWVMLLTMAGRCNSNGMIFLTENIPYTPKMLADELGFEENTVILALNALEQFNMIVKNQDFFSIAGWEEYQNIEGMEKIREQNRLRQAKYKEKQRLLQGNVTDNVIVTQGNATDIEEDKEKDKDLELEKKESDTAAPTTPARKKSDKPVKHKRGEYGHVLLTEEQEQKLMDEYGEIVTIKAIEFLDEYIEEKGYKAKNHYLTIRRWVIDAVKERAPKDKVLGNSFDTDDFFEAALQKHARNIANDAELRERANALKERLG